MIQGRPRGGSDAGWNVRPLEPTKCTNPPFCAGRIHGFGRRRSTERARDGAVADIAL